MGLQNSISASYKKITEFYEGKEIFWHRSPQLLLLKQSLKPLIAHHAKGRVLDAGAGASAYKPLFLKHADDYLAIDLRYRDSLGCVADLTKLPLKQNTFNTIFCSQVLEHIRAPCKVIEEFYRILKPEGNLLLTVPHLSCYHELPHDYYRFTSKGIAFLLTEGGFKIIELKECGGALSFLGHIFSYILLAVAGKIALLRTPLILINSIWVCLIAFIDSLATRIINPAPGNIIVVAAKTNNDTALTREIMGKLPHNFP